MANTLQDAISGRVGRGHAQQLMRSPSKNSLLRSALLVVLGVIALFAGAKSLILLIPAATLVWYEARPTLRSGRN